MTRRLRRRAPAFVLVALALGSSGSGAMRAGPPAALDASQPAAVDQCTTEEDWQGTSPSYCDAFFACSTSRVICMMHGRTGAFSQLYAGECPACQPGSLASPAFSGSGFVAGALSVEASDASGSPAELVSRGTGGGVGTGGPSLSPDLTPDGRFVAFDSAATDLVAGDTNGKHDIFVRDRVLATTSRVSVASDGTQANDDSVGAAISADGRFVAFLSRASNLVASDTNSLADVFVHDRQTGMTERASVSSAGVQAQAGGLHAGIPVGSWPMSSPLVSDTLLYVTYGFGNYDVDISADGRYVAFVSDAVNLVAADSNSLPDVFVRDRSGATTVRVSVRSNGTQMELDGLPANTPRPRLSMSGDGRSVAFDVLYPLTAEDTNANRDVYVHDLQTSATTRISVSSAGAQTAGYSGWPSMSHDGRYVAFGAGSLDLVPGSPTTRGVYLRDRLSGTTTIVPSTNPRVNAPSISADGSRVAFSAYTWTFVGNEVGYLADDAYVHDRLDGWTRRLNVGVVPDGATLSVKLNGDGTLVAFGSSSTNLAANDTNGSDDVFVTPAGVNLLANGHFANGTTNWLFFATPSSDYIQAVVANGVLEFNRVAPPPGTSNQAVAFQQTGVALPASSAIELGVSIGNSSTSRRRISVLLHDQDFSDLSVCTFWLEPGAPLRRYRIQTHTTRAWTGATVSFYAATHGTDGAYRLDDITLLPVPGNSVGRTYCFDPTVPVPPGGATSANLLTNGDFSLGLAPWGLFGQIVSQINAGVFEFYRPPGTPSGVVLQASGDAMPAGQIFVAQMQLGNSSDVRKRVTILAHDGDFTDLAACTFWLPPAAPMQFYAVRSFTTKAWTNATVSVYPATVGLEQWIRLDSAALVTAPALAIVGTECLEPNWMVADAIATQSR
jgi:Tol biopolymer transport system component